MIFTDTHIHLYDEQFTIDRNKMIKDAINLGIKYLILPSIDSNDTQKMFALKKEFPHHIFLMMGLHPCSVKENVQEELLFIKNYLEKEIFVGIGEIGIDLYWDKTFLQKQQDAFQTQILWAKEKNLPINIHCRNAFDEVFEILEQEKSEDLKGIFHCFTGDLAQAKKAISYHLKLGIGGVATFKNGKIDKFLNQIPLSEIVLETDAPYLAPTPFRGKRNEPKFLITIAKKLSDIYQMPLDEIAKITTKNAKDIFDLLGK